MTKQNDSGMVCGFLFHITKRLAAASLLCGNLFDKLELVSLKLRSIQSGHPVPNH